MATAGNSIVDTEAMQKLIAKVKKFDASIVAQLESHVSDSGNPHDVTAAQVGAYTTQETDERISQNLDASVLKIAAPSQSGTNTMIFYRGNLE